METTLGAIKKPNVQLEDSNMLIVGREVGQSVIIDDVIKVTILQIGSKPRLAIDAPKHIIINRVKQNENSSKGLNKRTKLIGDTIQIGESIKVSVLQTGSGLLRFAIDAPKHINIFREELYKPNVCPDIENLKFSLETK